jgi:hypothetical protein
MARPKVAGGRTACNMEGSREYIELAVADSRQGVVLQLGSWARCRQFLILETDLVTKQIHVLWAWTDTLVRHKQWKRDTSSGNGTGGGHGLD